MLDIKDSLDHGKCTLGPGTSLKSKVSACSFSGLLASVH